MSLELLAVETLATDGGDWFWRLLGRFHPLVVHFPIALLCTVVMVDGWRLFRGRRAPGPVVQMLLFAGAAGAVLSAALGWASASFEKSDPEMNGVLSLHQWMGTTVAVLAVVAALMTFPARRRKSAPAVWSYRATLWSCVALVAIASHYGGMLVYGEGYIESALPKQDAPVAPDDRWPTMVATVDFHRDIEPILQNHCVKCHGPQKVRGKLRLDTKELAMKGGSSGRVIVPGNGKESLLYTLLLDPDPDTRMPTKEKPLPKEQTDLVRLWIDQGATWPEVARSAEVPPAAKKTSRGAPTGIEPQGMVWIPPGAFIMGSEELPAWDARPRRLVNVVGFWMDRTETTNEEFEEFVKQTGHVTLAERMNASNPQAAAPPLGAASIFDPRAVDRPSPDNASCWKRMGGADWRHPEGPGSTIVGRERHPVVHVSWDDAAAYARWAGKRLPTEAEWERAARGGRQGQKFVWGDTLRRDGKWMANVAHAGGQELSVGSTVDVGRFAPNGYGLYDMAGNVWEWCADAYRPFPGARMGGPAEPKVFMRSMRGGSFLCSDGGCAGFLLGFRGKWEPDRPASHIGFRCVKSAE